MRYNIIKDYYQSMLIRYICKSLDGVYVHIKRYDSICSLTPFFPFSFSWIQFALGSATIKGPTIAGSKHPRLANVHRSPVDVARSIK